MQIYYISMGQESSISRNIQIFSDRFFLFFELRKFTPEIVCISFPNYKTYFWKNIRNSFNLSLESSISKNIRETFEKI